MAAARATANSALRPSLLCVAGERRCASAGLAQPRAPTRSGLELAGVVKSAAALSAPPAPAADPAERDAERRHALTSHADSWPRRRDGADVSPRCGLWRHLSGFVPCGVRSDQAAIRVLSSLGPDGR